MRHRRKADFAGWRPRVWRGFASLLTGLAAAAMTVACGVSEAEAQQAETVPIRASADGSAATMMLFTSPKARLRSPQEVVSPLRANRVARIPLRILFPPRLPRPRALPVGRVPPLLVPEGNRPRGDTLSGAGVSFQPAVAVTREKRV